MELGFAVLILELFSLGHIVQAASVSTTVVTTAAATTLTQNDYRWYENVNALNPTTASAALNTAADTPSANTVVRLRMNISDSGVELAAGAQFKLQFSNSTSSGFTDVGTSTSWIFHDNAGVSDGATIAVTLLSSSDVGESYNESNPSAATPNAIGIGQEGEFDWVIKNNSAAATQNWFFRMVYSSGTVLDAYDNYPRLNSVAAAGPSPQPSIGGGGLLKIGPTLEPLVPPSPCDELSVQIADLNRDCLVDIVDLSILLFYYERSGTNVAAFDLNGNSVVDFPDVSIMMFYWTGSFRK